MNKQLFTAIIFYSPEKNKRPHKYRKISRLESFITFAKTLGAESCNVYDRETREFIKSVKL